MKARAKKNDCPKTGHVPKMDICAPGEKKMGEHMKTTRGRGVLKPKK
jgi:hypothetical protein